MLESAHALNTKPISTSLDDERPRPDSADQANFHNHLARYQFALRWIRPGTDVLETACGTGYGSQLIASVAKRVLATDYSPLAIDYARRHFASPNLRFEVMDCNEWHVLPASYDCIVSFEVLEHLPNQVEYLRNCASALRPGGILLISTPNRSTAQIHMRSIQQVNEFHIGELNLTQFRSLLGQVFPRFTIYGQRRQGNAIYAALRALDVWNLRLRLIPSRKRDEMQRHFGVPTGHQAKAQDWIFARSQLRQANSFLAVCHKS